MNNLLSQKISGIFTNTQQSKAILQQRVDQLTHDYWELDWQRREYLFIDKGNQMYPDNAKQYELQYYQLLDDIRDYRHHLFADYDWAEAVEVVMMGLLH